ncbi:MAG: bifunctional phosphopantothenoylcysteine decarboxylase/phosphopantothenate--cysteine ligase CoaBC [SAR202 cluster bacterium]|nr:bifunctional phosphopantothenoylcysteine decarboxylase/phosphopantothenate--cysteine ligase CoaBC [SAR202 cluster bacterium]
MTHPLQNKSIVLGVTGSIACYKAADLASKLVQAGALVDVIMTESATRFVTPLTFHSITHRPVVTDLFNPQTGTVEHIEMARRADIIVVAPATANTIAKLAHGFADDALAATVLATTAPVLLCPAMDGNMYANAATQDNIERLKARGFTFAGPASGHLASGMTGAGRLVETSEITGWIRLALGRKGDLAGRKVVVSAGGTQEAIDPVRYITNRSSGKMGYAIADAARDRGANAVLVAAPTALPDPTGIRVARVQNVREMQAALTAECKDADAIIMAAAVSDWRPATKAAQKVKKGAAATWSIDLVKNPDVIAGLEGSRLIKVGFAAETEDLEEHAREKIASKGLHFIVANDITAHDAGFAVDDNRVTIIDRDGGAEHLELMSKYEVGLRILDRVAALLK